MITQDAIEKIFHTKSYNEDSKKITQTLINRNINIIANPIPTGVFFWIDPSTSINLNGINIVNITDLSPNQIVMNPYKNIPIINYTKFKLPVIDTTNNSGLKLSEDHMIMLEIFEANRNKINMVWANKMKVDLKWNIEL
jgi:hypothetical protein